MTYEQNYLAHHGIKGQQWGIRRYQNEDGTLTDQGKSRYLSYVGKSSGLRLRGRDESRPRTPNPNERFKIARKRSNPVEKLRENSTKYAKGSADPDHEAKKKEKVKKIMAIAGGTALAAIAGYLAYKTGKNWTGKLQSQLRSQAKDRSDQWFVNKLNGINLHTDNKAAARMLRASKGKMDPYEYGIRMKNAMGNAKRSGKLLRTATEKEAHYRKIAETATRGDALKNFLKNKGKIILS